MWARAWAAAVVVAVWGSVRASLDLYVDAEDVKQLLGEWLVVAQLLGNKGHGAAVQSVACLERRVGRQEWH